MSTARVSSSLMLAHLECLQDLRECEGKGKLHDNERHSMVGGRLICLNTLKVDIEKDLNSEKAPDAASCMQIEL